MTRTRKLTAKHQKRHNTALILQAIYTHESISRVQIARLTGLSRPTVTALTQNLLDEGLIEETGALKKKGKAGKRPTLLSLQPDARHIIAIEINEARCSGALLDLRGRIHFRQTTTCTDLPPAETIDQVAALIADLSRQTDRPLLGIGIGVPGILNGQDGVIYEASNLGWRDFALKPALADRFHLPVYMGNDTNLGVLGEYHFGPDTAGDDMVGIMLSNGIGAGIMVDGKIVTGSGFAAGEIGHIPINGVDILCNCGKRGCLETVSSGWGVRRAAADAIRQHPDSELARLASGTPPTLDVLAQAAHAGDPATLAILEQAGHYLGLVLASIVCLLNPGEIVLGGRMIPFWPWLEAPVRQAVTDHVLPPSQRQTVIRPCTLDEDWILMGATALVLGGELNLWPV